MPDDANSLVAARPFDKGPLRPALKLMSDINGLALSATFDMDITMYASVTDPIKVLLSIWIGDCGVARYA